MMKRFNVLLWLCIGCFSMHAQTKIVLKFTLKTQYDKEYTYQPGAKTILVFADKESGKQAKEWVVNLKKENQPYQMVSIACMGYVPFFMKGMVRSMFKEKPAIYMDWGNDVAEKFNYTKEKCLIVYLDERGVVKFSAKGPFNAEQFGKLNTLFVN